MSGSCCGGSSKSEPNKVSAPVAQPVAATVEQHAAKSQKDECCNDKPAKSEKSGCCC